MNSLPPTFALVLLLTLWAPALPAADGYKKGTVVRIEGRVVDVAGDGVTSAKVVLSASRQARRINPLRRGDRGPVATTATSDADGRYAFDWVWDGYHDTFLLEVVLEAIGTDGHDSDGREVLGSAEISQRLAGESPVVVDLEVFGGSLVRFAARAKRGWSPDEQRVWAELGRPERYDTEEQHGETEESWWYFQQGRMYRFAAGALLQVVHFDPVTPAE